MPETFDTVPTNPASGGTKLSGEQVVQSGVTEFLPACYLIYGPKGGPYNRVDVPTGLPVQVENSPAVSVANFPATQPVSGTVTANQGGAPWQQDLTQVGGSAVALGQAAMAASFPVVIASNQSNVPVSVQNFPATQAVSGTVNVGNFPTTQTVSGTVNVGNFPATQAVSGTVTVNQGTSQWAVNLDQVNGSTVSLGQTTMAHSIPVVIASDQTITVSGGNSAAGATGSAVPSSADYAGLNVGGNLRGWTGVNPTGSAYAGQVDLASVGGTSVALGQTGMSGSIPVVLASNQSSIPVSATISGTVTVSVSGTAQVGVTTWGGNTVAGAVAAADGTTAGAAAEVNAFRMGYNDNTSEWDRWRSNTEGTALSSAARTATTTSASITNYNGRGIACFLNVTHASGTGGLWLLILMVDPVSGNTAKLTTTVNSGLITTTGQYLFIMYPGANTGVSGTGASVYNNGVLPRTFQVEVTHNDTSSYTYSVGYSLIQ